jgi:putative heme-binding domain-containing protein
MWLVDGGGDVKINRAALILLLLLGTGGHAIAQHATAFDIEDGGRAFENTCANCHGPDGNLIAGIDFSRGVFRRPLSDEEITAIIIDGIANTPMPPTPGMSEEQALKIVAYLRSLPELDGEATVNANPARGREIVTASSDCLECHRLAGQGSRFGPDLSRIGLDRRAAEMERSLLDPESEVLPNNRTYTVTPRRGAAVTGRLLNHDTFTVQMMDQDGRLRLFQKSELRDFGFVDSPMPSYRDKLDTQALADVVSFLVSMRGELPQ